MWLRNSPGLRFAPSPIPVPTGTPTPVLAARGASSWLVILVTWREEFPGCPCPQLPAPCSLHPPWWVLEVQAPGWATSRSHRLSAAELVSGCRGSPTGDTAPESPRDTTPWPGEGAGSQRGRFLEWGMQTKSYPLISNAEQFLLGFLPKGISFLLTFLFFVFW